MSDEKEPAPLFGGADAAGGDDADDGPDDGTGVDESAGDALEFQPKVQVSEVDVKTMEEDEEVCLKQRCKLYVFVAEDVYGGEIRKNWWRERGTGDAKLLKHKELGKVRLLMRQEKTLKICANHLVSPHVELKPNVGTDRSWVFTASDFADEELKTETFAIKFASAELANAFKEAIELAKQINAGTVGPDALKPISDDDDAAPAAAAAGNNEDSERAAIDAQIDKRNRLEEAEDVAEDAAERLKAAAADATSAAADALASGVQKLGLAGGFGAADVESEEVKAAAAFAVDKIGKGALVKVAEAQQQVVAGMNYLLLLHVKHDSEGGAVHAHKVKVYKPLPHEGKPMELSEHSHQGPV